MYLLCCLLSHVRNKREEEMEHGPRARAKNKREIGPFLDRRAIKWLQRALKCSTSVQISGHGLSSMLWRLPSLHGVFFAWHKARARKNLGQMMNARTS